MALASLPNPNSYGHLLQGMQESTQSQEVKCIVRNKFTLDPSRRQYGSLADSFDYFNRTLFSGRLAQPLLTLNHRPACVKSYHRDKGFSFRGGPWKSRIRASEISLNPRAMVGRSDMEILTVIVHEMVHLWQFQYAEKPPRKGYHNRDWADFMEELGLIPSNTGEPGGKRTGQKVSQYVLPGGPFDLACRALLESGWRLDWHAPPDQSQVPENPAKAIKANNSKTKFTCYGCHQNAWAKPSAELVCGRCNIRMTCAIQADTCACSQRFENL